MSSSVRQRPPQPSEQTNGGAFEPLAQQSRRGNPLLRLIRWLRLKWFQYEITMAANCFVWWEQVMMHLIILGTLLLVTYGLWRQGNYAFHSAHRYLQEKHREDLKWFSGFI